MIKLNPEYTEHIIWNPTEPEAEGVFARIWFDEKIIKYYPRYIYAPAWPVIYYFTMKHERAHSWGIRHCLSNSKFCIMFEDNDTWIGKVKILPYQIVYLGMFCQECRDFLNENRT